MYYEFKAGSDSEVYPKRTISSTSSKLQKCCLNGFQCCFLNYMDIVDNGGFCEKVAGVGFKFTFEEMTRFDRLRDSKQITQLGLEMENFFYGKSHCTCDPWATVLYMQNNTIRSLLI